MSKGTRTYQAGIRMTKELWADVLKYAEIQQIPAAEYCRRAIEKQITIEKRGTAEQKEQFKQDVLEVLKELGLQ